MKDRRDWLPGSRDGQVAMVEKWKVVLASNGTGWGVSAAEQAELSDLLQDAKLVLAKAKDESTRTPVITAQCKVAFKAMIVKMRFIKNHFFLKPPLTDQDFISLGLKPPDETRTPIPAPEGQATADVSYPGIGVLELHCRHIAGQPLVDKRSEFGYCVYWSVMPPGGASVEEALGPKRELMKEPETGDDLTHFQWGRRPRERFYFPGDSGKTAWFCVRYENGKGDFGHWGPLIPAVIP